MSDATGKWASRGIGAAGLCTVAGSAFATGGVPLAAAAGLACVAGATLAAGLAHAALATRHPVDVPARRGERPGPDDGAILLGAGPAGEVRISPSRMAGGLCVAGPDALRRAVMADISRQAAEAGMAHVVISCSPNDMLAETIRSDGAGSPWTLTILDAEAQGQDATHCLAPFAGLPAQSVARIVTAANPAMRGEGARAAAARALLQAACAALCHLHAEGYVDFFSIQMLADHLDLRRVIDLTDRDLYPCVADDLRAPLRSYLGSLPGYQEEKKYKQAMTTLDHHAGAAAMVTEGLRWARGPGAPRCVTGLPDVLPVGLTAPGTRTVIRAAHGPGEERALGFLVACLSESLRGRPRDGAASMPFMVIADGIDAFPPEVAEDVLAMARRGAVVVRGVVDAGNGAGAAHASGSSLRLDLPGYRSDGCAVLVADGRSLPLDVTPPARPRKVLPVRRRIPLSAPSRADMEFAARLPLVLATLIDGGLPEEIDERSREARETVPARAEAGDPIAVAALRLALVPGEDRRASACGAIMDVLALDLAEARRPAVRDVEAPLPARPTRAPAAPGSAVPANGDLMLDFDDFASLTEPPPPPFERAGRAPAAVVVPEAASRDAYLAETPWKALAGKPMPLATLRDHQSAKETLRAEFPHLGEIIDRIVNDAARGDHVRLRPILLHGSSGSGKSRLARRLAETLGLKPMSYNCGGASDASFGGTSRQWSSARASLPLQLIRRTGIANPAIILDEVEKVGSGKQNGNFADLMLGLTERETASRSFDLYVEAEVDLSHVTWIGTANSIDRLHAAFRDRFRAVEVPLPGIEHADVLVPAIVKAVNADRGTAPEWAFVPTAAEIDMMAEAWGGGSLRRLKVVVERTLDAVEGMDRRLLH